MKTFKVLDITQKPIASGEEIGNTYRVYMSKFEKGFRDFEELAELFEATGGYALQTELFAAPIVPCQLNLFIDKDKGV